MNTDIAIKIQNLYKSCYEALNGQWDRSDDGFIAMADDLETIMKHFEIKIPDIEQSDDEEF